jgi:putative membrane protein
MTAAGSDRVMITVGRVVLLATGILLSRGPARAEDVGALTDFLTRASVGNIFAVAESRLAFKRAPDPQVRAFARRLLQEQQSAQAALKAAAAGSGVPFPTTLDQDHAARLAALRRTSGAAFDKAFVTDQVEDHSNALTLYGDYMLLGDNAALKALAVRLIPVTEAQLKVAQKLSGG